MYQFSLLFSLFFVFSLAPLSAAQSNPVIEEALKLAASLDGSSKIRANQIVQRAQSRLGTGKQGTGTLQESFEAARKITDASQRSQAFGQVARMITPENINSYDEILKEEVGYFVLEAVLEQCRNAEKYGLGYQLLEKIIEQQTEPILKRKMWVYINRLVPYHVATGKIDEAVASANRLNDDGLRQYVLGQIKITANDCLIRFLLNGNPDEGNKAVAENILKHLYPNVDMTDMAVVFAEVFAKMIKEAEQITEPNTRFIAYMQLVGEYQKVNVPAELPDPTLSKFLLAAAEAAKNIKEDTGNATRQGRLAIAVRRMIDNADMQSANQVIDHMLTIPAQIENPSNRAGAMLDLIPLLYQLNRKADADKVCGDVLSLANSAEGQRYGLSHVRMQVAFEKANAGLFSEANELGNWRIHESIDHGFADAYSNHISRLLAENRFDDALQFIDDEPTALGDKILLLQIVGYAYRQSGDVAQSDETYKKMFALVDTLAETKAERNKPDDPRNRSGDRGDDQGGWFGASLAKTYSHPIVQQRRERSDLASAVDLASKLFHTHDPGTGIIYIARRYADDGDYAGAIEAGGNDSAIKGYTAYAMFQHGKKEEAEKLLTETLREIDGGMAALHADFVAGLVLCGRVADAVRLTMPSEGEEMPDLRSQQPDVILKCLLMSGREAEALKLVDEWKYDHGKAWAIWRLTQWNQEEYLDKGAAPFLTPERRKHYAGFMVNYTDTLKDGIHWHAEILLDLDAKEAALKILLKALAVVHYVDPRVSLLDQFNAVNSRLQMGKMLIRLGEREKADAAFTALIKICARLEPDYRKVDSLRGILFEYAESLMEEKPERIRTWSGYAKSENNSSAMTLRYLWNSSLFSQHSGR